MRTDMAKVIVERPRLSRPPRGKGSPYPRGRLKTIFERDLEGAPSKLGMGFPHAEKWLNENLAPLRRFVMGKVGRRWDLVRAEISAHVRRTSAVQAHVFEHLGDMVIENVEMVDGRPHMRRWGKLEPIAGRRHKDTLWVCPRTGRLRPAPPVQKPKPRFGRWVCLGPVGELREIDGRWMHVTLAPIRSEASVDGLYDVLLGERLSTARHFDHRRTFHKLFGRSNAVAVAIREPGRRELALIEKRFRSARGS